MYVTVSLEHGEGADVGPVFACQKAGRMPPPGWTEAGPDAKRYSPGDTSLMKGAQRTDIWYVTLISLTESRCWCCTLNWNADPGIPSIRERVQKAQSTIYGG
jgi:hypothetical protein